MASSFQTNLALFIVYLNVALYATCYQIQRPLEPFLVDKLMKTSDSADEYAKLQSFFSIVQTVGSLLTGYYLDKFSVKMGFVVSFLASAMSYYLLSQAVTIEILYASKIPTIFQAGFLCAQLAVSQLTEDGTERVTALGRLTMSYTVGMVLGPAIGGYLGSTGDYYYAAKLAVGGSFLSVVLTLFMPSTSTSLPKPPITDAKATIQPTYAWTAVVKVISVVWLLLGTKVVTSVANAMASAALPLILKDTYQFDESKMGLTMSAMSGVNAVVNGLLIGYLLGFFDNLLSVVTVCVTSMAALYAAQSVLALPAVNTVFFSSSGVIEFFVTSLVLSVFQYLMATTITGESTARVDPNSKGTLLGLEHSLWAAARVVAPQTGVYLWKTGGVSAVAAACSGVFVFVLVVWEAFKHTLLAAPKAKAEAHNGEERKMK